METTYDDDYYDDYDALYYEGGEPSSSANGTSDGTSDGTSEDDFCRAASTGLDPALFDPAALRFFPRLLGGVSPSPAAAAVGAAAGIVGWYTLLLLVLAARWALCRRGVDMERSDNSSRRRREREIKGTR